MPKLRTLLVLGRVSNVPTVWSNCLAGWLLAGGGEWNQFALLCFAATCLYVGGMYLNDAFDAQFDQQHRPERPIPSRSIRLEAVWGLGFLWLITGLTCLFPFEKTTIIFALLLTVAILVYDAVHKIFAFSPVLMAACRFFLILLAASTGREGVTGLAIWSGLVLAAYIVGLSYLAKNESTLVALRYWPCMFLIAPLVLAMVANQGEYWVRAAAFSALFGLWMLRCLWFALWSSHRNIGLAVSGLLAAIPLVDLLSVWDGGVVLALVFVGLFVLSLLLQRVVPAT